MRQRETYLYGSSGGVSPRPPRNNYQKVRSEHVFLEGSFATTDIINISAQKVRKTLVMLIIWGS